MFGLFGCGKKIDKLKAQYEEKIALLEAELEKREKCSNNTLEKLNAVDDVISNLKKDILENKAKVSDEDSNNKDI